MPSTEEKIAQIEEAIAAQDALRAVLGETVVEATLTALRAQLATLRGKPESARVVVASDMGSSRQLSPEQLLAHLQSYLPKELADKMRATGRIEGERKQVTVLFADLAGFTALSERLDPEEVTLLTNEALQEMAAAVYQYEGYIDKFIGDAVMAVFGAPVAHEDDPERALRAALAMRERMAGFNRQWAERLGEPVAIHIGINSGPVIAGNVGSDLRLSYTVMGDTVNTASRLEDAADLDQILVSHDTYRLTEEAFTFTRQPPLVVKGKREPLVVYALEEARLRPGKARGLKDLASVFVGREGEMVQLNEVMVRLAAGHGQIVTITGEAGIGKSRLMAEWRASAQAQGVRWLEGRAFSHTTSLPFGPLRDLLRSYSGIGAQDTSAQGRAKLAATIGPQVPSDEEQLLAEDGPTMGQVEARVIFTHLLGLYSPEETPAWLTDLPAPSFREHLFAAVTSWLAHLANAGPLLLVIEDMHWIDTSSVELIEHLLELTQELPLGVVGLFRVHHQETPRILQAVAAVRYPNSFRHLALTPLSEQAGTMMVEQLLALPDLPPLLKDLIVQKAEGNPFFVEEVLRTLIERGALVHAETGVGWVTTPLIERITVPDTLQGLLMARIDRLPDETKWTLQQAAVIGRVFSYRVLRQLAGSAPTLDADLNHLLREELIRERTPAPDPSYIFKHGLVQEVAYGSLLTPRRREIHRRVGAALAEVFADRLGLNTPIIGDHYLRGEAWAEAASSLITAGDLSAKIYSFSEARQHYEKALSALEHLPDTPDNRRRRASTLLKYDEASYLTEDPARSRARLEGVLQLLQSLDDAGDLGLLAQLYFNLGRSYSLGNDQPRSLGYFQQSLAVAQELGDTNLAARPAFAIGLVLCLQGHFTQGVALLEQATAVLERNAQWDEWIIASLYYALALAHGGQYQKGLQIANHVLARTRQLNSLTGIAQSLGLKTMVLLVGGDLASIRAIAEEAIAVPQQSGDLMLVALNHGMRAWAESRLGQQEEAAVSLAAYQAITQQLGGQIFFSDWLAAAEAGVILRAGRIEEALERATAVTAAADVQGGVFAGAVARRIIARARHLQEPEAQEEIDGYLAASLATLSASGAALEAARTHLAWAQIMLDRGDKAGSTAHREAAGAIFAAAGLSTDSL